MGQSQSRKPQEVHIESLEQRWEHRCYNRTNTVSLQLQDVETYIEKGEPIHELLQKLSFADRKAVIQEYLWMYDRTLIDDDELCKKASLKIFKDNVQEDVLETIQSLIQKDEWMRKMHTEADFYKIDVNPYDIRKLMEMHHYTLRSLSLPHQELMGTKQGMKEIAKFLHDPDSVLETLNLENCFLDEEAIIILAEALRHNHSLRHLDLSGTDFAHKGASVFSDALAENTALQRLTIGETSNIALLVDGVYRNSSLRELDIWGCAMDSSDIMALGIVLAHTTHITSINLSNTKLGDDGITLFAETISENTTLEDIILHSCGIGNRGAEAVAHLIATIPSLKTIGLDSNLIGDQGAKYLAISLYQPDVSLSSLSLKENRINEKGVCALAKALRHNSSLKKLDLIRNNVGDKGAKCFAKTLCVNTALKTLMLTETKIGEEGAKEIVKSLKINDTLSWLTIHNNLISKGTAEKLRKQIRSKVAKTNSQ